MELPIVLEDLISDLDQAADLPEPLHTTVAMSSILNWFAEDYPGNFFQQMTCCPPVTGNSYCRHLVWVSPEYGYSILLMVWPPGSSTPLHDHAQQYCLGVVLDGELQISHQEVTAQNKDIFQFSEADIETCRVGDVEVLVPPREYHVVRNITPAQATSLHVYQGEMLWSHRFEQIEGCHVRVKCDLAYDSSVDFAVQAS